MIDPAPVGLELSLGDDEFFGRLHVELASWCDFDAWMDVQAELLSQRWLHKAAPVACRSRRPRPPVPRT
ncbi:MAG: hypothetical protein KY475_20625 [Planctomycetes bacterium]|nr:hypothetical protein [Planctomycetota bacterium]